MSFKSTFIPYQRKSIRASVSSSASRTDHQKDIGGNSLLLPVLWTFYRALDWRKDKSPTRTTKDPVTGWLATWPNGEWRLGCLWVRHIWRVQQLTIYFKLNKLARHLRNILRDFGRHRLAFIQIHDWMCHLKANPTHGFLLLLISTSMIEWNDRLNRRRVAN